MLKYELLHTNKNKTLVFLHGFCENSSLFQNQVAYFKQEFNILTIDLPGFGKSNTINNITINKMADEVKIVIDYLKIKQCYLFGHSMGGYVSLAFAKKYKHLLAALGLLHSTAAKDSFERLTKRKQLIVFIQKNSPTLFYKTFFPALFFNKEDNKNAIQDLIKNAEKSNPSGVIEAIKAMMMREENYSVLETINIPVFFAIGKHDQIIIDKDMFEQAALCKTAEVCYLQNSNHMGMIEESNKLNKAIEQFVNRF
jgi:pimeloyl-ACP methyl ester carboxylesterase